MIRFTLNGTPVEVDACPTRRVIDLLREDFGLTAAKEGCGSGECGACAALLDGRAVATCLVLAGELEGRALVAPEGLGDPADPHPVQRALAERGGVQCGFCSPGMTVAAADLLARDPAPDRAAIRTGISGNLCRCTGYGKIVDAVAAAAVDHEAGRRFVPPPPVFRGRGEGRRGPKLHQPTTFEELWPLLAAGAKPLAGGTDGLVQARRAGGLAIDCVSLSRIPELTRIGCEGGRIRLGAAATHAELLESDLVRDRLDVLVQALRTLGSPLVRNRGTLGGNLGTASPAGDCLPPLLVLDADIELRSRNGVRTVPLEAFLLGPGKTARKPGEIITAALVDPPKDGAVQHFEKVGLRRALAVAVASLAALVERDGEGVATKVRLAFGSVGPTALRVREAEAALVGARLDEDALREAAALVRTAVRPIDDCRASAAHRRRLAGNLLFKLPDQL